MKRNFCTLIFVLICLLCAAQDFQFKSQEWFLPNLNDADTIVSMIFAGDIMGHAPQFKAAYNADTKEYNYDICFKNIKQYIAEIDFAVANLEVPIDGEPYSGYPNFSSPDALLDALKNAGYNVLLTANNHVADRGAHGIKRTIEQVQKRSFRYAGSYLSTAQKDTIYPLILTKNNFKIALLNYTFSTNGNPVNKPLLVNIIDTLQIISDLQKAETIADFTIVCIHWGEEYKTQANASQRKLATIMVKNGADLIIGGHPHVVQNAEYLINTKNRKVPIFYSVGNSISNQRNLNTDGGIMVRVKISTKSKRILETSYLPVYVYKGTLDGIFQYHLIPTPDFIFAPEKFKIPIADSTSLMIFDKNTQNRLKDFKILY
ncbi:MAG: CapA family protein [Paludibacter sp.]|nr:CapA family protein [Paludibacter sp.]